MRVLIPTWSRYFLILDSSTQRDVAIKIVVANKPETQNHELEILQHVSKKDGSPLEKGVPKYLVETLKHGHRDVGPRQWRGLARGLWLGCVSCDQPPFVLGDWPRHLLSCYSLLCREPADGDTYTPLIASLGFGL